MRSCCRGSACTGRACVAGRWGPSLLRRARCVRSANGRLWCWGHRIGHGAFRIRPARRRDRRTAGPLPARGRVRGDALSTCMDCGLVSGACLWLSYIRGTVSRRKPGGGNRRWSIPCTSIPHHHVSAGLACLSLLVYAHSDGSGRSVSDMPFGQDGVTQPKELGESKVDMKRVQTVCLRFEPSNPLTIMPCTSRNVKSSRVGKAACARRRDGRAAVPSRSCRPVESCRDCATSRSCSRRIGTRIRAGVRRIPLP